MLSLRQRLGIEPLSLNFATLYFVRLREKLWRDLLHSFNSDLLATIPLAEKVEPEGIEPSIQEDLNRPLNDTQCDDPKWTGRDLNPELRGASAMFSPIKTTGPILHF